MGEGGDDLCVGILFSKFRDRFGQMPMQARGHNTVCYFQARQGKEIGEAKLTWGVAGRNFTHVGQTLSNSGISLCSFG
jgi:hypothetical protein